MKTKDMSYGRAPKTRGYTKIVAKLNLLSGWKLRQELGTIADGVHTDTGAFESHAERKDWENALVCLEDAIEGALKLRKLLKP